MRRANGLRHEIGQRRLCPRPIVFIYVEHQRRDRAVPNMRPDLVESESGLLP
jgi:hypothetical protein